MTVEDARDIGRQDEPAKRKDRADDFGGWAMSHWSEGIMDKARALAIESAELALEGAPEPHLRQCESPIERLFLCALWMRGYWPGQLDFSRATNFDGLCEAARNSPVPVVAPQIVIGPYRVDFLLATHFSSDEPMGLVAVECDGHEFHEKTKEQAARDKARDREITIRGVQVLRYTGSEIWRDAGSCADEVLQFIQSDWAEKAFRDHQRSLEKSS
jgi:very-short-patch-repair endonuclease